MKKILITGVNGFIGQHLLKKLENHSNIYCIYNSSLKVRNYPSNITFINWNLSGDIPDRLRGLEFDTVFHLAANPNSSNHDIDGVYMNNIMLTANAIKIPHKRFVFTSSITAYGKTHYRVMENAKLNPTTLYGASKASCETLIHAALENAVTIRFSAVLGRDTTHGIIPVAKKKLQTDKDYIEFVGDKPGTTKPYVYIDDAVDALIHAANIDYNGVINFSSQSTLSILDIAEIAMKKLNINKQIKWLGDDKLWRGDNKFVQISNLLSLNLGFKYNFTPEQAVELSI
jgi:UDP-glucose 4-epimerase